MLTGIIGRKVGMTQLFAQDGTVTPGTVIKAGPCVVVQTKSAGSDGYEAVQIGLVEDNPPKKVTKPMAGRFEKAGIPPVKRLAEFQLDDGEEAKAGDEVKASIFAENDWVDVAGISKGKGFQGVVKRHGFGGGRATHGSMFHRAPGSIGSSAFPSRVFKGMRAAGHMGARRATVKNLKVVRVDAENNLLFLRGAVPGAPHSTIALRRARRG